MAKRGRSTSRRSGQRLAGLLCAAAALLSACSDCDGDGLDELVPLITPSSDAMVLGPVYVGASETKAVSLRSSGTAPVELRAVRIDGDAAFELTTSAAGILAPGTTKELEVTFVPAAPGAFSASLIVESDAENDPELVLAVVATALAPEPCDDNNECTAEIFNASLGTCVTTWLSGACDDGSGCTSDDRCFEGACVGTALLCGADNMCEIGVCAASEGCLSLPDPDVCDDDNPCTIDSCDAAAGCSTAPAADGTPCAAPSGCEQARVCLSGTCVAVDVPDGTPCVDGDLCTIMDVCQDGLCSGTRVEREPEVMGTLHTFGIASSAAVVLDDGSLLFRDSPAHALSTVLTSVVPSASSLDVTAH